MNDVNLRFTKPYFIKYYLRISRGMSCGEISRLLVPTIGSVILVDDPSKTDGITQDARIALEGVIESRPLWKPMHSATTI
jgi:hypothetical protein